MRNIFVFRRFYFLLVCLLVTILLPIRAPAQSTSQSPADAATVSSDQQGPLRIHVTAVQGGAQYRPDSKSKWQSVTAGLDLTEGVEFRTGPKGVIQFTVGTDQVFRVDRLTVVKMLRANLMADGTIRTDVGMTYGRVSKDVDLPSHPHQDTIVSPSSTLAVRGTRVSLYDQPPYEPQAVSFTGRAFFHNLFNPTVQLGGKGSSPVTVAGDAPGPGQFQLQNTLINPNGQFSGTTGPETNILLTGPGGLKGTPLGPVQNGSLLAQGQGLPTQNMGGSGGGGGGGGGAMPMPGDLQISISWASESTFTVVDFSVTDPNGVVDASQTPLAAPVGGNGPVYSGSRIGDLGGSFQGTEAFEWGNPAAGAFPTGTYVLSVTLEGTVGTTLMSAPTTTVAFVGIAKTVPNSASPSTQLPVSAATSDTVLSATTPSVTFDVTVPFNDGTVLSTHPGGVGTAVRRH